MSICDCVGRVVGGSFDGFDGLVAVVVGRGLGDVMGMG